LFLINWHLYDENHFYLGSSNPFLFSEYCFTYSQHSLQFDGGTGNYGLLSGTGLNAGYTVFTFPPAGGLIVTSLTIGNIAWVLNGNTLSGVLPGSPTQWFGSVNGADVILKLLVMNSYRLLSSGGINLPLTVAGGTGIIFQNGIRLIHSFGSNNFFSGLVSGNLTMTGGFNTVSGVGAYQNATTGSFNTAVGFQALLSNLSGNDNVALGVNALVNNSTGNGNIAIGRDALLNNADGSGNTGIGLQSLNINLSGIFNTATGYRSLATNLQGMRILRMV